MEIVEQDRPGAPRGRGHGVAAPPCSGGTWCRWLRVEPIAPASRSRAPMCRARSSNGERPENDEGALTS